MEIYCTFHHITPEKIVLHTYILHTVDGFHSNLMELSSCPKNIVFRTQKTR